MEVETSTTTTTTTTDTTTSTVQQRRRRNRQKNIQIRAVFDKDDEYGFLYTYDNIQKRQEFIAFDIPIEMVGEVGLEMKKLSNQEDIRPGQHFFGGGHGFYYMIRLIDEKVEREQIKKISRDKSSVGKGSKDKEICIHLLSTLPIMHVLEPSSVELSTFFFFLILGAHVSNLIHIVYRKLYVKTMYIYLINLSAADMLLISFRILDINSHLNHMLLASIGSGCFYASTLFTTFISIDRFICVRYGIRYEE